MPPTDFKGTKGYYQVRNGNWDDVNYVLRQLSSRLAALNRTIESPELASQAEQLRQLEINLTAQNTLVANQIDSETSFYDILARTDQPFFVGNEWTSSVCVLNAFSGATMAAFCNTTGSGLSLTNSTGGGGNTRLLLNPLTMNNTLLWTRRQWAQYQIKSDNSTVVVLTRIGPAVYSSANTPIMYSALFNPETGVVRLHRINGATETYIGASIGFSMDDYVAIEVIPGPTSNQVNLFINAVLEDVVVDTDASRPTYGLPGINFLFASASRAQVLQHFFCGSGPYPGLFVPS